MFIIITIIVSLFFATAIFFFISEKDRKYTNKTLQHQYTGKHLVCALSSLVNVPITKYTPTWLLKELPIYENPDENVFPNVNLLRDNWKLVRDEYRAVRSAREIAKIKNDSFFRGIADDSWKRLYLKWYGPMDKDAKRLMPKTCELIEQMPEVKLAMISILGPKGKISGHSGQFRGCLRYHLGLDVPQCSGSTGSASTANADAIANASICTSASCENKQECFISVGGKRYSWKNGSDVIFDDTFFHYVENNTDQERVILFIDIVRPQTTKFREKWNNFLIRTIAPLTTRANSKLEKVEKI